MGDNMAKLLILGPSYRRSVSSELKPAIECYDGLLYRIVKSCLCNVRRKGIDIVIVAEDLEVVPPRIEDTVQATSRRQVENNTAHHKRPGENREATEADTRDCEEQRVRRGIHSSKQALSATTTKFNTIHQESNSRL